MDAEDPADPRENLEVLEVVEKPLRLNRINGSDPPAGVAGAGMGEDVLYPVAGEERGKGFDPPFIPEESFVFAIPLEPLIIPEPAMLEPDSVGTKIVSPIEKGLARGPEQIGQAHHSEDGDQQKKPTPWTFLVGHILIVFCG
ncbi:MAG: hypothetical protein WHS86_12510 [Desulfosoma sp.]